MSRNGSTLYVGGFFDTVDAIIKSKGLSKWNGTNWSKVGEGINGYVLSSTMNGNELYIAGIFDTVGKIRSKNIAKWNGIVWSPLGNGVSDKNSYPLINTMLYNNGNLYVGGKFDSAGKIKVNNISKWDGISWTTLGNGTNGEINSIAILNGILYVGGDFTIAGNDTCNGIAKWNI